MKLLVIAIFDLIFFNFIQLGSNGYVSFDEARALISSTLFPTDNTLYVVAPYLDDFDPSTGGNISYEVHFGTNFTSPLMSKVNTYVSKRENLTDFSGSWMMIAEWRNVPPFGDDTTVSCCSWKII